MFVQSFTFGDLSVAFFEGHGADCLTPFRRKPSVQINLTLQLRPANSYSLRTSFDTFQKETKCADQSDTTAKGTPP